MRPRSMSGPLLALRRRHCWHGRSTLYHTATLFLPHGRTPCRCTPSGAHDTWRTCTPTAILLARGAPSVRLCVRCVVRATGCSRPYFFRSSSSLWRTVPPCAGQQHDSQRQHQECERLKRQQADEAAVRDTRGQGGTNHAQFHESVCAGHDSLGLHKRSLASARRPFSRSMAVHRNHHLDGALSLLDTENQVCRRAGRYGCGAQRRSVTTLSFDGRKMVQTCGDGEVLTWGRCSAWGKVTGSPFSRDTPATSDNGHSVSTSFGGLYYAPLCCCDTEDIDRDTGTV